MSRYESHLNIGRSTAEAFAAISDIARWSEWTDMREVTHDQAGPIAVGSSGSFTMPGPFRGPIHFEATTYEPGRLVAYVMSHPAFDWHAEMRVEPEGAGSRVSSSGDFRMRGWRRVLQPMVAREVRRGEANELIRLREILEREAAA